MVYRGACLSGDIELVMKNRLSTYHDVRSLSSMDKMLVSKPKHGVRTPVRSKFNIGMVAFVMG